MFLTDAEIEDLTGYRQPARQARALDERGVRYFLRRDGRVRVTWDQVNAQGAPAARRGPNLEAARG